jgi:hypothetical protein
MNHFLFEGYKVCYTDVGQGEPLVFLHNGGNDHRVWEHQVAYFAKTRRVLARSITLASAHRTSRVSTTLCRSTRT